MFSLSGCPPQVSPCWLMSLRSLLKEVSVSTTNPASLLPILRIKVLFLMLWLHFSSEFISLYSIMTLVNLRLFVYFKEKATTPTDKFWAHYIEQYFFSVKHVLQLNV